MACHGVLPHEREIPQPFVVDVELGLDLRAAGERDDLDETVNYAEVYDVVSAVLTRTRKYLIEAVAEETAEVLLRGFAQVRWVRVTVHKPAAPIDGIFTDVGVTLLRRRKAPAC